MRHAAKSELGKLEAKFGGPAKMENGGDVPSPSKSGTPVQKLQPCIEKYTEMLDTSESDDSRLDLLRKWSNEEHLSFVYHLSTLSSIPANFSSLLDLLAVVIKET
jgi:hypothetical protein